MAEGKYQPSSPDPVPANEAQAESSIKADSSATFEDLDGPAQDEPIESLSSTLPRDLVSGPVRARNALLGNNFNGPVYFSDQSGDETTSVERTAHAHSLTEGYADSPMLKEIRHAVLAEDAFIAVFGKPGLGKKSACLVALADRADSPIFELSGDSSWREIARSIKQVKEVKPAACFLIGNVDAGSLADLNDHLLLAIEQALAQGGKSCLLITVQGPASAQNRSGLTTVEGVAPNLADLAEAFILSNLDAAEVTERAGRLMESIGSAGYGALEAIVDTIRRHPEATDEQLSDLVSERDVSLTFDDWQIQSRSPLQIAMLACIATGEGTPRAELERQGRLLAGYLVKDADQTAPVPMRAASDPDLEPVVQLLPRRFATHFGWQVEDVYQLREPLEVTAVVQYLWSHLGAEFRAGYLRWLRRIASSSEAELRMGAAIAAGALLVIEPRFTERELIRWWALSGKRHLLLAAAIAVGVPTALNESNSVGRKLVNSWIGDENESLLHCAVLAYGGPLGAWDISSAAPVRLWRLGLDKPKLEPLCNESLAGLCVAGPDAVQIRYAVLSLLVEQMPKKASIARRALTVFAAVVETMTDGRSNEESLRSLLDGGEEPALDAFALLLSKSWSMPRAARTGSFILHSLIESAETQVIDYSHIADLVRRAKRWAKDGGTITQLGAGLRAALLRECRSCEEHSTAWRLTQQFFPEDLRRIRWTNQTYH
ncbi:hypothetical protein F1D05_36625 [Kribbella qitaiheensis]|uniref:Uncharacterized protein n=1 Tax=Kribbella qitaiheensis TaxID=1544730 RepID=A0A7G6X853_9ACTN|nr:hypothetical protein [Kribbella qitaiheensis]QNE22418.1 hypothetical protein F1D05_36625 [Kribbella qitaiheensis]